VPLENKTLTFKTIFRGRKANPLLKELAVNYKELKLAHARDMERLEAAVGNYTKAHAEKSYTEIAADLGMERFRLVLILKKLGFRRLGGHPGVKKPKTSVEVTEQ
jgi:hypothetical protein